MKRRARRRSIRCWRPATGISSPYRAASRWRDRLPLLGHLQLFALQHDLPRKVFSGARRIVSGQEEADRDDVRAREPVMQASIDLQWVREIEYDTELATGTVPPTGKVLRLRSHSQTFEFVLPNDVVARWQMMMPPRRAIQPAVDVPVAASELVVEAVSAT